MHINTHMHIYSRVAGFHLAFSKVFSVSCPSPHSLLFCAFPSPNPLNFSCSIPHFLFPSPEFCLPSLKRVRLRLLLVSDFYEPSNVNVLE